MDVYMITDLKIDKISILLYRTNKHIPKEKNQGGS